MFIGKSFMDYEKRKQVSDQVREVGVVEGNRVTVKVGGEWGGLRRNDASMWWRKEEIRKCARIGYRNRGFKLENVR